MNCSCIKGDGSYHFTLEPLDCETLIYKDFSEWMEEDYYVVPDYYEVQVIPPGSTDPLPLLLKVNESNSITTRELFGSKEKSCIPDGVYCFILENCQYKYTKHKAVTCSLRCELDSLIATSDDEQRIEELELLVRSIHEKTNLGQIDKASKLYDIARKLINKCKCNC